MRPRYSNVTVLALVLALSACAGPRVEPDSEGFTWNALPGWPEDRPAALIHVDPGIQVVSVDARNAPQRVATVRVPDGDHVLEVLCGANRVEEITTLMQRFAANQVWSLSPDRTGAGCHGRLELIETTTANEEAPTQSTD